MRNTDGKAVKRMVNSREGGWTDLGEHRFFKRNEYIFYEYIQAGKERGVSHVILPMRKAVSFAAVQERISRLYAAFPNGSMNKGMRDSLLAHLISPSVWEALTLFCAKNGIKKKRTN